MRFIKRIASEVTVFEEGGKYFMHVSTKYGEALKRITFEKYEELIGADS